MANRVKEQLAFLVRADALKSVTRANVALGGARRENTAEHSWHLALWSMVFADLDPEADPDRTLLMCLLHDLVEIVAGDHPLHQGHDPFDVARLEADAADRIFPVLPEDQAAHFQDVWEDFEQGDSREAQLVRMYDMAHPVFQELANPARSDLDTDVLRDILITGRAAALADLWPDLHAHALALLYGTGERPPEPLAARLRFLAEADLLKGILRGTPTMDGARRENSAEHSWHLALFAHVLAEHGPAEADPARAAAMLVLHDLVEIDAGDQPIHGQFDAAAQEARERAAADRLFGMLPDDAGRAMRALWDEFEAAESSDAIFAKSVDRVQPVMANLESGGGTWITYAVTRDQLESRVGSKVLRGVPAVWHALVPRIDDWFAHR